MTGLLCGHLPLGVHPSFVLTSPQCARRGQPSQAPGHLRAVIQVMLAQDSAARTVESNRSYSALFEDGTLVWLILDTSITRGR